MIETVWGLSPYAAILIGAALPTHIWRWLGVLAAGRLDDGSELFVVVRAVATALVAGVIAKLLLDPSGALGALPLWVRAGAAAVGFACYVASRGRLVVGIAVAEALLVAGWFAFGG